VTTLKPALGGDQALPTQPLTFTPDPLVLAKQIELFRNHTQPEVKKSQELLKQQIISCK